MWLPRIGVVELVIFGVVILLSPLLAVRGSRWLLGIVPCFAIALLVTPPDPGSTILVGAALSTAYVIGVLLSKLLLTDRG